MLPRLLTPLAKRSFSVTPLSGSAYRSLVDSVRPSVKEMSVSELNAKLSATKALPPQFHLIDVRETYEWNETRIPKAKYTGRGMLERDIAAVVPDTNDQVVVYCAGGVRSILAAETLQRLGYKNVYSLEGGIGAWKNAKLRVEDARQSFSTAE